MVCRGLYFDELERIVNIKRAQIKDSAASLSKKQTVKGKGKGVLIVRKP